jgi:zinc/manganese transport system ATP-binding protein
MTAAKLASVTVRLSGRTVLNDISFTLHQGEFVALLGSNGAGKTTLLRTLLGIAKPQSGQVDVLGAAARPGRQGIGYMPQTATRSPTLGLSGRDFVATAAAGTTWGLPRLNPTQRASVDQALDSVGATQFAARPIGRLSGGERQRLLLAQALLGQPRLLLLDEPLAGLDPPGQHDIVALIRTVQRQLGCTVLFSAHGLNVLLPVLDRVLYLASGRAAIGTAEAVVTSQVLSALYGSPIEVTRAAGRIFVEAA